MNTIPLVRRRMRVSGDRVLFGLHPWRCRMSTSSGSSSDRVFKWQLFTLSAQSGGTQKADSE